MSNSPFETFVDLLYPPKRKYTLLLGSGLSLTSELLEARNLTSLDEFYDSIQDKDLGECTKILEEHFKKLQLGEGYHCLAQLIQEGYFKAVFTTNIDPFLENALTASKQVKVVVRHRHTDESITNSLRPPSNERTVVCLLRGHIDEKYNIQLGDIREFPAPLESIVKEYLSGDMILSGFISNADFDIGECIPKPKWPAWYISPDPHPQLPSNLYTGKLLSGAEAEFNHFFRKLLDDLHKKEKFNASNTIPVHSQLPSSPTQPSQKDLVPMNMQDQQRDFFISYNSHDRQWAEWIAWQLDQDGYSVFIEAWDSLPGRNMILDMQQAASQSKRTIAVLSQDYLKAPLTQTQWAAALVQDPTGQHQMLLPVRVHECEPTGILKAIRPIDLVGLDEAEAQKQLLEGVGLRSKKPDVSPLFPGGAVPKVNLASNSSLPENPPYPQNLSPKEEIINPQNTLAEEEQQKKPQETPMSKTENTGKIDANTVTDVVIITALQKELEAVLRHLDSPEPVKTKGRTFYKASVRVQGSNNSYQVVVLSLSGMGNYHAALSTQQAISIWNPSHIILTGIAGGVQKETSRYLGDLLVGEQIVGYEPGKQTESGIQRRYEVYRPAKILLDAAKSLPRQEWALSTIIPRPDGTTGRVIPDVYFGVIASGEKVVDSTALINDLQSDWSQLVGIEMEGVGTALATYYADYLPGMLLVKGICDWANGTKNDVWQEYAADVAASFVIALLKSKPFESKGKPQPIENDGKPASFPGRVKLSICKQLVSDWSDLADYFDIPAYHRAQFTKGREPHAVWEWLEQRGKLPRLKDGLAFIDRNDLVKLLEEHQDNR